MFDNTFISSLITLLHGVAARALHEPGYVAGRVSLPGQASQTLPGGLDELIVVQAAVAPPVKDLEHQPHALGAQLLPGDDLRGSREVRLNKNVYVKEAFMKWTGERVFGWDGELLKTSAYNNWV